jgi:hypothetical protein
MVKERLPIKVIKPTAQKDLVMYVEVPVVNVKEYEIIFKSISKLVDFRQLIFYKIANS